MITRQVHRDKVGLRSKLEIKSVGQGANQQGTWLGTGIAQARIRAEHLSLYAAPKQRWGVPVEHFLTQIFLHNSDARSHSCTVSELGCLFLEDSVKHLSLPLPCLQAEHTVCSNLYLEKIPLATVLPVVNPCLLHVQQGNDSHVICPVRSQL